MPTPSEKKALGFLAIVAVLGAVVRMSGAVADASAADASSREALRRQIVAAESAGATERNRRGGGAVTPRRRARGRPVGSIAPADSARAADARDLFNPPPVIPPTRSAPSRAPAVPVDVDRASASELEALPRIGAALAKRIIEDRESRGPFGSLAGFQRVRGVGPAMAAALSASVTFSGTPRPSIAGGPRPNGPPKARGARRRGAPP